jgi:hypothetical protein
LYGRQCNCRAKKQLPSGTLGTPIKIAPYLSRMIAIDYPPYEPNIRQQPNGRLIFDGIRRQWVALTPEEWVRQHFVQYLLQIKKYPAPLLAIEKEIMLGDLRKRCDIVVFNRQGQPLLLVECKQPSVALDDKVLQQALRYNIVLQVPYIVITNGTHTAGFRCRQATADPLAALPDWEVLDAG